jgi:hypothetical protein
VHTVELAVLSPSVCKRLGAQILGEGGSSKVCISLVLCRVGFGGFVVVTYLTKENKEEELVNVAPGWG